MNTSRCCHAVSQPEFSLKTGKGCAQAKQQKNLRTESAFGVLFTVAFSLALTLFSSLAAAGYRPVLPIDNNCVISILNRTVSPDPSGVFQLENVPSFMGKIRARATCVRDGVSLTGETEYFEVPENGAVQVGQFYQAEAEITPTQLTVLGSQPITLEGVGSENRLSVLATYSDGTTRTVTSEVFGTNYTSSNPAIATVDSNGVIHSVASGVALITVRKDGVLTVVTANVVTSGDTDGDGIPDDIELANGMNPNDPVDAFEDQDKDGLSALQEYQLGTGINNADSDGDGILDGEEVVLGADGYITNPLLADTDNDGISDGLELTLGSNPTDINDAPYSAALTALNVTPKSTVLFYNTIDTESFLQMTVTGTLIDGSEVNLTDTGRGTNYTSSDLSIANFGTEPGKVFAGVDGVATVTAENNGFSGDSLVNVITFAPRPLGFLDLPSSLPPANLAMSVENGYLFVITSNNRLLTIGFDDENISGAERVLIEWSTL